MFSTLLVANRGEIAIRVIRTAREMGLRTVAVHSDADAGSPHVPAADLAVALGGHAAADSYLRIDRLVDAARRAGAEAVHPGYGFLAENADFADACVGAGLVFVGPTGAMIRAMADKAAAKARAEAAGVPVVPGYRGDDHSPARMRTEADAIGYPVLVKAIAGGGGRGMRRVGSADELESALGAAAREAASAFGDDRLMLERAIDDARHIEVQVIGDRHGALIHLGDRDCSTQRRRQKIIEEAPAPHLPADLRERLHRDALTLAGSIGYVGAGTVEFIVDSHGRHHFLEMNTRLQVEHPVTEMITGIDLVEWQLRIAAGEPLPLTQSQVRFDGCAIEARWCAEDPYADFAPQAGRVLRWVCPPTGPDLRVDAGITDGQQVPPWYDSMIAKVIAHGRDRPQATRRLARALENGALLGIAHNGRLLRDLLCDTPFAQAAIDTGLLDRWRAQGHPLLQAPRPDEDTWSIAAALRCAGSGAGGWRPAGLASWPLELVSGGDSRRMTITQHDAATFAVRLGETTRCVRIVHGPGDTPVDAGAGATRVDVDGLSRRVQVACDGDVLHLAIDAASFVFTAPVRATRGGGADAARQVRAPIAGLLGQLLVDAGDAVEAGQRLASVEAMKMELWLDAPFTTRVIAVRRRAGDPVAQGDVVIELAPAAPAA